MRNGIASQIGGNGVHPSPDDPSRSVSGQESAPSHSARTSQNCGICAKDRNEPAKEHHLLTMGVENIAADLELPFVDPDVASILARHGIAESVPDPKADVVTSDRSSDRHSKNHPG